MRSRRALQDHGLPSSAFTLRVRRSSRLTVMSSTEIGYPRVPRLPPMMAWSVVMEVLVRRWTMQYQTLKLLQIMNSK